MVSHSRALRILLVGSNGQLGNELQRALAPLGEVIRAAQDEPHDAHVDLTVESDVAHAVSNHLPDVVVNAAAYTGVDRAEEDETLAHAVNARAPGWLAAACARYGSTLIHYSTDYVFSGDGERPYTEEDPTDPKTAYGRTKLAGDEAVLAGESPCIVLRAGWLYTAEHPSFLRTMLCLLTEQDRIAVSSDQVGGPTWAASLADVTAQILRRVSAEEATFLQAFDLVRGVYHVAPGGTTSGYGFASQIAGEIRAACRVDEATGDAIEAGASRPTYSVLDASKLERVFGIRLAPWDEALRQCLDRAA